MLEDLGVIGGGPAISDGDMAPAFERREHHEQFGHAVALILVIAADRAARLHRDGRARLGDELLGGLVQADQRPVGITQPRIDLQHVLHRRDEGGVATKAALALGGITQHCQAVGPERVFFRTRPMVECKRCPDPTFS